jgi:flavin-dependent thymidylate synthase
MRLKSEAPRVTLVKTFKTPFNNAVATARTCYSSRIITDADVAKNEKSEAQRDRIAQSIYLAGHHTTLQHATFQFAFEQVSRQAIWSFFHAHPFYNSEQVSQRYVEVKPDRVLVPALENDAAQTRFEKAIHRQMDVYQRLITALEPATAAAYYGIFPARKKRDDPRWPRAIKKKCQEIARYVLPIGTHAHLYHTVSGLTLHRYNRLAQTWDCPSEQRAIIEAMVAAVNAEDPLFFRDVEDEIPLEDTQEAQVFADLEKAPFDPDRAREFVAEFDAGLEGRWSRLIDFTHQADKVMGRGVRQVLGLPQSQMSDAHAVALLLDPTKNPGLSEALNLNTLGKITRVLDMVHFTFQKKISHTADSQAQRHRMLPGARPLLTAHVVPDAPDYILPGIFNEALASEARVLYEQEMRDVFEDIAFMVDAGVSPEAWQYLLPNAFPIRFTESGTLMDHHHKWSSRLCYNAQEEIWRSCLDEVLQVHDQMPEVGQHLGPPCHLRKAAKSRPICPEGDRFCGIPVWKQDKQEFLRVL